MEIPGLSLKDRSIVPAGRISLTRLIVIGRRRFEWPGLDNTHTRVAIGTAKTIFVCARPSVLLHQWRTTPVFNACDIAMPIMDTARGAAIAPRVQI
jgi:hypothetical protein